MNGTTHHNGATPFYAACQAGHAELVTLLAKKSAVDIEKPDRNGVTPYVIAEANGHKGVLAAIDWARRARAAEQEQG